nr:uncharacterized protein LOC126528975 isoform X6 [Dermacentor andersoni]
MVGKERAARQTAKRKLQRATETAEEREVRLAKRRAQYAAKQQRSSTESEVKDEVASVSGSTSTRSDRRNATKRRIRAEETPEQRQQRLEKERAYRKRQSEKRKEQLAEEMVLLQTQECLTDANIEQREAERCEEHARRVREFESATLGEALPAADGVKARRTRVHRTERRWPLVTCPHHSTSAAGTLRVATADFSAVFPDIDFKQAVETACDKAPFIEASLAGTTCQVEPWRGLQDKCVGECEALLQHAEQSCQTEHHITLVRCTKPQVSTCSVEVQADPWWQHHCGIQPIGVDLCET